jgi:hypothetical protein
VELRIDGKEGLNYLTKLVKKPEENNNEVTISIRVKLYRGHLCGVLDLICQHPVISLTKLTIYPTLVVDEVKQWRILNPPSTSMTDEEILANAKQIPDLISKSPALTYLNMFNSKINRDQWTDIFNTIKDHTSLKTLKLRSCRLFEDGDPDLICQTLTEHPSITSLNIRQNRFNPKDTKRSLTDLFRSPKLKKLNLVNTTRTTQTYEVIEALKNHTSLTSLRMNYVRGSWEKMKEILIGPNANTTLEEVYFFELSAVELSSPENKTAVEVLQKNQFLTKISTDLLWRNANSLLHKNRLRKIDAKNIFNAAQTILLARDRGNFDLLPKELLLQIFHETQCANISNNWGARGKDNNYLLNMVQIEKIIQLAHDREFLASGSDSDVKRQLFFKGVLTCT